LPIDNEFTRILQWPGYRVYRQEIDEKKKVLDLWVRRKRGNRKLECSGCGRKFSDAHDCNERAVRDLPAGGRTPLASGIVHAADLLGAIASGQHGSRSRVALLLTDGRAADPEGRARAALARVVANADRTVVVDLEEGRVRLGLAAELAAAAGADLTRLVSPGATDLRHPGHRSAA